MNIKVLKFGGSSLADAEQFRKVANIVKSEPERRYVVASAPGKRNSDDVKVTDMLYNCFELASKHLDIDEQFAKIEERYNGIISDLEMDFSLREEFDKIKMSILHHAGSDYIASRGEYLNSMILANFLGYDFIDAETGIFFQEDGKLDSDKTNKILSYILTQHSHAVIPGFYGVMPNGTIKTFSRGGSDITGSIVARAIKADLYENWTDVSGMLMADPRCVDNPKVIDLITYQELRELAYMGASVMHEEAIFPVREACIPINIKNTNKPEDKGTMIVPVADSAVSSTVITGIAGKKGFSTISIEKDMMNSQPGFLRKILEILENHHISCDHIPTGIDAISIIVNTNDIKDKKEDVTIDIFKAVNPDTLSIQDGFALIAVVGRGMVKAKGTAGRVFSSVAAANINIGMIDQGSSELNIIIGVDANDYIPTLKAIYKEFVK